VERVHATTGVDRDRQSLVPGQADGPRMDGDPGAATKRDSKPQKKQSTCPCSFDPCPRTAGCLVDERPCPRTARQPNYPITVTTQPPRVQAGKRPMLDMGERVGPPVWTAEAAAPSARGV
jgi:hypothetical protein